MRKYEEGTHNHLYSSHLQLPPLHFDICFQPISSYHFLNTNHPPNEGTLFLTRILRHVYHDKRFLQFKGDLNSFSGRERRQVHYRKQRKLGGNINPRQTPLVTGGLCLHRVLTLPVP